MSKRKVELCLIDTTVYIAIYIGVAVFAGMGVGSLQVNGEFNILKFLVLYGCVLDARIMANVYQSVWRYANVDTYLKLVLADMVGGLAYMVIGRFLPASSIGVTASLLVMMGSVIATLSTRFLYQVYYAYKGRYTDLMVAKNEESEIHKINIAIVGAGNVGSTLAAELTRNPKSHYAPYCFIDNDHEKIGNGINGIRIYPEDENVIELLKEMPVQEIIIALPDATPEDKSRLYNLYKQTGCKVKLYDYLLGESGKPEGKRTFRDFRIEDLLFRDALKVSSDKAKDYYKNKTVLVTGGGGSIGSELCRQIAALKPKKLIILDIYENNAYEIQQELIRKYGSDLCLDIVIASVRDEKRLDKLFDAMRPDIVFHAAAHKHVPLMERSGCEAIKNNVMGTYHVANVAEKYGVEKFLLISTDKAVNPTNIMGASKRLCEMIIQCRQDSKTEFTAVRFGNVLGSNGSVIPLFKRQIENGGPVTLTDKRIIRYFMTIPEAVGLVMETGAMAHNGELFVLNMGKPVKILELAENMIRLSGYQPYIDIDIQEIGLRPGEKLYEELLMKSEELDKTDNEMIFIERDKGLSREEVEEKLEILMAAARAETKEAVLEAIRKTVPTYHSPEEVNRRAAESKEMNAAMESVAV